MSTRSRIGIVNENETITSVYCHFDGYIKNGVGEMLLYNYADEEEIEDIMSLGDISTLGPSVNSTVFYCRDKEENRNDTKANISNNLQEFLLLKQAYNYLFTNNRWNIVEDNKIIPL